MKVDCFMNQPTSLPMYVYGRAMDSDDESRCITNCIIRGKLRCGKVIGVRLLHRFMIRID